MNEIRPPPSPIEGSQPGLGLPETRPTVTVVPELQGRLDPVVIRDPDEPDADYHDRFDFVMLTLNRTEKV